MNSGDSGSFTRLRYDNCDAKTYLKQSVSLLFDRTHYLGVSKPIKDFKLCLSISPVEASILILSVLKSPVSKVILNTCHISKC